MTCGSPDVARRICEVLLGSEDVRDAHEFIVDDDGEVVGGESVRLADDQVVNLSLGHPIYAPAADDPLVQAVEQASAAGLVVVVSAGNYGISDATGLPGYTGITSPGNSPSGITAGDERWRQFAPFELVWAGGVAGRIAGHAIGLWERQSVALGSALARYREGAKAREKVREARMAEANRQAGTRGPRPQSSDDNVGS